MERVTVRVTALDEGNMPRDALAQEITREGSTVETALAWAMNDAEVWMLRRAEQHGDDAFDLTVSL